MGQFRYILTNLGEKMSDEEVDELLKAVDTSSGELNYMGELLRTRLCKTAILTNISCRHGQDDPRKLKSRRLDFPFILLFSLSRHETKLARILAFNGLHLRFAKGLGRKISSYPEAEAEAKAKASERRSLVHRPGTRWSGLVTCIQQSIIDFRQCTVPVLSGRCQEISPRRVVQL